MKKTILSLLVTSSLALAACQQAAEPTAVKLDTPAQKFSYSLGFQQGSSFPTELVSDIDINALTQGLKDGLAKKDPQLTEKELNEAAETIMKQLQEKMAKTQEAATAEGKKFLEENTKREGVTTTQSGLQYEVITKAEGKQAKASDTVTVHYKGTLLNGNEFDSSYKRNEPATFPLSNVIQGWQEGIPLMKVGEKFKFYIPSNLAYGAQSPSPDIPANSVLVFEVELLNIDSK